MAALLIVGCTEGVSPQLAAHGGLAGSARGGLGTVKLEAETGTQEPASPLVTFVDSTTSRQMEEPSLPCKENNSHQPQVVVTSWFCS